MHPHRHRPANLTIQLDDPARQDITSLLQEHLQDMAMHSPPESVHALDLPALQAPTIAFYAARDGDELLGCAALKTLSATDGELKSMRTVEKHLRKGIAGALLEHIISEARRKGMQRLSLETGTPAAFEPARALYQRFGFSTCPPFADYVDDPYSVCMSLQLNAAAETPDG